MKTIIQSIIAALILFLQFPAVAQTNLNFDKIKVAGSATVELNQGESNSISIESAVSSDLTSLYSVTPDSLLVINGKKGDKINVTMTHLSRVTIAGTGKLKSEKLFNVQDLNVVVAGVGKVELNLNASGVVDAHISGTGKIVLEGTGTTLNIDISGAGKVDAENFKVKECTANISGSGKCLVNVSDILNSNISGSGNIYYITLPATINKNISGSGVVGDANATVQDTTKISIGKRKLLIVDSEGKSVKLGFKDVVSTSPKIKSHWSGFDLGINMLADKDFSTSAPKGYEFLELRTGKSIALNFNLVDYEVKLHRRNIMLVTGLGFTINNYRFTSDAYLLPGTDSLTAFLDPAVNIKKNKLVVNYVTVPLLLEFNTSQNPDKTFHIALGVIGGLKLGSHLKLIKESNGNESKSKTRDDFNLNPWRYDATVRLGYRNFTVFGSYGLASLFKDNKGPELSPLTLGMRVVGW